MASTYDIAGRYKRVYHYHIRKTAGTSLDAAFWGLAGLELTEFGTRTRVCKNGLIIVRGDKHRIERGHYFFGSSHAPAHELNLPESTFTITILRDPLARVLSHYRYLLWRRDSREAVALEPFFEELGPELPWLGDSFRDFLRRLPKDYLLRQLYMFSRGYDVREALDRLASVSAVAFTEEFAEGLRKISDELRLPLSVKHERRFDFHTAPTDSELDLARSLLQPEFELLSQLRLQMRHT